MPGARDCRFVLHGAQGIEFVGLGQDMATGTVFIARPDRTTMAQPDGDSPISFAYDFFTKRGGRVRGLPALGLG